MAFKLFSTAAPKKRRRSFEGDGTGENEQRRPASFGIRDPRAAGGGYTSHAQPEQQAAPASENGGGAGQSGSEGGNGTGAGFDDYYNRLISTLRSYGIEMELPTLDELYSQLSAFLRPSVDEAIANRRSYGETVLAELDADAYSRGMGGSSYLSSMKNREYNAAASDIAAMESKYSATLAQYLYNAGNELARIQAEFEQIRRQHEYELQRQREQQRHELELQRRREQQELEMQRRREQQQRYMQQLRSQKSGSGSGAGSGGSHGSGGSSGEGAGAPLTEEEYRANYNFYCVYMRSITEAERRKVFTSDGAFWQRLRNEMLADLTPEAYQRLRELYDPAYQGGSGSQHGPQHGTD